MTPASSHVLLGILALLSYAAAAGAYIRNLFRPQEALAKGASTLAAFGVVLNLAALYSRAMAVHSVPYRDLLGSMALFGFFLGALNLVLEFRHRDRSLGPFLEPAAFLLLLVALLLPQSSSRPRPELRGSIFALHVTLNMLAYAAFAVACALSGLYLVVRRSLKRVATQRFDGPASRLPSLAYLERANRTSLTLGVIALATGLALGMFWASRVWKPTDPHWATDPMVAVAVLTLVFYFWIVVRALRGAAPVSTAKLSVAGFVLVLVSYTAINLLFSRLHAFVS
jgi:ABC-type transport system involved in cytochrome c biogenesis permease subunit